MDEPGGGGGGGVLLAAGVVSTDERRAETRRRRLGSHALHRQHAPALLRQLGARLRVRVSSVLQPSSN